MAAFSSSVLVVEDDFLQAQSTALMLKDASFDVIGPFPDMKSAWPALRSKAVDCVLLDLDLGHGLDFGAARELSLIGIPTMLLTGYSASVLPDDLAKIRLVEKPVLGSELVEALASMIVRPDGVLWRPPK